ncbi:MAG: DUF2934 domain-containing protein [Deinococcus sp.]|nr:DUF2934 domain-containing protein [Deinococcus sp.]
MPRQAKSKHTKGRENPGTQKSPRAIESKAQVEVAEEAIRLRAYEIYLARSGAPGDPVADWLQAEQELRTRQKSS